MRDFRFRAVLLGSAVLVVPVLAFHRGLLMGELPIGGDLISQFIPWRRFALSELAEGRFPWWNPLIFCGTPFAANIQTSLFYPFNLLHALVRDPHRFFACSILFHHILAGLTMYLWQARRGWIRNSQSTIRNPELYGCLFSALVWQWSAFLICHMHDGHLIHLRACAWMPLVFWGQDRLLAQRSVRGLLACGIPFALMVLGGHVQVPYYAACLLLARGIALMWDGVEMRERLTAGLHGFGMTAGALAVAGGLLAFVILPLHELSANSSARAGGATYELASSDSLPLTHLPLLVAPFAYGDPLSPFPGKKYWGGSTGYHEIAGYMGILTLCLIPFALGRRISEGLSGVQQRRGQPRTLVLAGRDRGRPVWSARTGGRFACDCIYVPARICVLPRAWPSSADRHLGWSRLGWQGIGGHAAGRGFDGTPERPAPIHGRAGASCLRAIRSDESLALWR